jgi:ketosteroid isomerase-like protein
MSEENVEIVRAAFHAFNRGDLDAAIADAAPDAEYVATGAIPGVGRVYRGPDGFRRFLEGFWSEFIDARIELHELIETGNQALASTTLRGRGKQSGVEANWQIWTLWTLRNGKVARGQSFVSRGEALEAAGLSG